MFSIQSFSQEEERNIFECGTYSSPEEEMLDKFYEDPDNQIYVDILLEHGIDIPENYLELIENGETFTINSSMFSSGSKVYWIPIKAWIYRENSNPSSNISVANVQTTIGLLNDIFTVTNTNIHFYLLCVGSPKNSTV